MAILSGKLLAVFLAATAAWSTAAAQSSIHKCLKGGVTQYQDAPCSNSQVSVPYIAPYTETPAARSSPIAPVAEPGRPDSAAVAIVTSDIAGLWRGHELVPGLSDTVVLNRARWGRPENITRTRTAEGYREAWTYAAAADGRVRTLHFLNGRLEAIDLGTTAAAIAINESRPEERYGQARAPRTGPGQATSSLAVGDMPVRPISAPEAVPGTIVRIYESRQDSDSIVLIDPEEAGYGSGAAPTIRTGVRGERASTTAAASRSEQSSVHASAASRVADESRRIESSAKESWQRADAMSAMAPE